MTDPFKEAFENAETFTTEAPQPLVRKALPATAFPVAALRQRAGPGGAGNP